MVKANKYIVDPNSGDVSWWKGKGVHIDNTNPTAQAWLTAKMDNVLNMGLDGWKLDMGPDMLHVFGTTVTLSAGSTKGTTMALTDFQKYYYQTIYDHAISLNPEKVITARGYTATESGTENKAPITKDPLCWQGDFAGDFPGIVSQAAMVYQTAIHGYGCPGVEVGGYDGNSATKNSLIRYAQFGALTPYMENGGMNGGLTNHIPWYWDQQTTDIYRYFATLHKELSPYNFSGIVDCHLNSGSQMKSCDVTNYTHKLGNDIFVGLITTDVISRNITVPANDKWIDYWNENTSNTVYNGGTTITGYSAPLDKFPMFIRAGAIIPMDVQTNVTAHGDTTSKGKITVLWYPYGTSNMTFHRPTGTGVTYENVTLSMNEGSGTITVSGPTAVNYRFRVKSFSAPIGVTGATSYSYDATSKVLTIDETAAASFTITISNLLGYSNLIGGEPCLGVQGGGAGLQGIVFGLPSSAAGMEYCKASDGNTSTFYDALQVDTAYTGLDLVSAKTISQIRYYPRSGQTARMTGGKFQGSNTSSSSGFVDLYVITGNPALQWNTVAVTNPTAFRWVRYLSPIGGHGNVAEVEYYQAGVSQYTLTTSAVNGFITLNPPGGTYSSGTVVTAAASPNSGYTFSGWSGDLTGTANPTTITMNANKNITALFTAVSTGYTFEAENLTRTSSGATTYIDNNANFSGSNQVRLSATGANQYIEFTLPNIAVGTYDVKIYTEEKTTRGQFQASFGGTKISTVKDEYYNGDIYQQVIDLGNVTVTTAGNKLFRMTVTGKSAASTSYWISCDKLVIK
jgi:uncharacterized repeat protein (TIGR02543 family)